MACRYIYKKRSSVFLELKIDMLRPSVIDRWSWIYTNFLYYPPILSEGQNALQISHINLVIMSITRYFKLDNIILLRSLKHEGLWKTMWSLIENQWTEILTHIQQRHKLLINTNWLQSKCRASALWGSIRHFDINWALYSDLGSPCIYSIPILVIYILRIPRNCYWVLVFIWRP